MENVHVQRELTTLFRQASGIEPNTKGWTQAIDELFERGATPQDIISRAKLGLSNQFHRPKLLDAGAKYINWKYNDLKSSSTPTSPTRVRTFESMKYDGWHHQRWEVELHKYDPSRTITPQEIRVWLEAYMTEHSATAYDMEVCPVCTNQR